MPTIVLGKVVGADATINGVNTLNIEAGDNIELEQADGVLTINATGANATHASQHASDGDDPITPEIIGAVNTAGDTMMGELRFADPVTTDIVTRIIQYNGAFFLRNQTVDGNYREIAFDPNTSPLYSTSVDGVVAQYPILHTGNKNLITPSDINAAPGGAGVGEKAVDISGKDLTAYLASGKSGFYRGGNVTNAPVVSSGNNGWWYFTVICGGSSIYATVIAQALYDASNVQCATYTNGTLSSWKKVAITTASGMLKGDGAGGITAAVAGTDYAAASHGTHVTYGTSAKALGTSSAGTATTVSRSDHVHALPALTSCTGTLTVSKGGLGVTTLTSGAALIGNGTGAVTTRSIRNNTTTTGAVTADTALITSNTLAYALNRLTSVAAADTYYTKLIARGTSLNSAETTPAVNGAIAWTYG